MPLLIDASIVVAGWVRDCIRKIEATMIPHDDDDTIHYSDDEDEGYSDSYDEKIYWDDERVY